jgi:hypothetical protein
VNPTTHRESHSDHHVSWRARKDSNLRPLGSKDSGLVCENAVNYSVNSLTSRGKLALVGYRKHRGNTGYDVGFPTVRRV